MSSDRLYEYGRLLTSEMNRSADTLYVFSRDNGVELLTSEMNRSADTIHVIAEPTVVVGC